MSSASRCSASVAVRFLSLTATFPFCVERGLANFDAQGLVNSRSSWENAGWPFSQAVRENPGKSSGLVC